MIKEINILDITFTSGNETEIINKFLKQKGYIVAPAAPALVDAENDKYFKLCLQKSTMAILDSGFLVLLNNLLKKNKVNRFSGLTFMKKIFRVLKKLDFEKSLWVLSSEKDIDPTKKLLKQKNITHFEYYIAPQYPKSGPIIVLFKWLPGSHTEFY